jgi:hypothetical protein
MGQVWAACRVCDKVLPCSVAHVAQLVSSERERGAQERRQPLQGTPLAAVFYRTLTPASAGAWPHPHTRTYCTGPRARLPTHDGCASRCPALRHIIKTCSSRPYPQHAAHSGLPAAPAHTARLWPPDRISLLRCPAMLPRPQGAPFFFSQHLALRPSGNCHRRDSLAAFQEAFANLADPRKPADPMPQGPGACRLRARAAASTASRLPLGLPARAVVVRRTRVKRRRPPPRVTAHAHACGALRSLSRPRPPDAPKRSPGPGGRRAAAPRARARSVLDVERKPKLGRLGQVGRVELAGQRQLGQRLELGLVQQRRDAGVVQPRLGQRAAVEALGVPARAAARRRVAAGPSGARAR